jgi:hypothetical protein
MAGWRKELAVRRERRFLRIGSSAAQQLDAARVEPVQIPDYIALPLLESATLVDDEGHLRVGDRSLSPRQAQFDVALKMQVFIS